MPRPPRVAYEALDAWPNVDGRVIELTRPHDAYRGVISRVGHEAEGTLDLLVAAVRDAAEKMVDRGDVEALAARDLLATLEAHELACDCLVWWSKVIADRP